MGLGELLKKASDLACKYADDQSAGLTQAVLLQDVDAIAKNHAEIAELLANMNKGYIDNANGSITTYRSIVTQGALDYVAEIFEPLPLD